MSFEVCVVGFGPTGATLAALLGQAGVRTLVVDKSREVYDKPRAFALDHEIMRVFQNLGLAAAVAPHTAPFTPSEYYGADGRLIKRLGSVPPPYPLGWPPNMVFNQPAVEAVLRQGAAAHPSVEIRLGEELKGFSASSSEVEIELSRSKETATYLVGCDGAASFVRQKLGIAHEDLGFDEPWLVVDLVVDDAALAKLPKVSIQYCEPARPATYLVGPGNHRRWEIMLLPGEDGAALAQAPQVWQLLSRWLKPNDAQLWRAASYRFHALVASRWRNGPVFLAGDAAHQQPPFTGQGMCQGIRDAANLAWKLKHSISSGRSGLLETYEQERKPHVRRLTSTIKEIGRLICERDPVAARARDERLIGEAGGEVRTVPRQSLIPGLEAGFLSPLAHAANGTLFPQPRLRDGRLLDDAAARDFQVFRKNDFLKNGKYEEAEGVSAAWFERHGCMAALVRPDHYVYGVARNERELEEQKATMEKALWN
ncbi:MAG: bifunctional 3-(3-hydroxy-phenyl)propionate/3-hydroxycinnamic acid hydroxylase [Clostridia bacterium]